MAAGTSTPLRLEGLAAKIEVTYGTDSIPTGGADAVRLSERAFSTFTPRHVWMNTREDVGNASLIALPPALPKGRFGELRIVWDARGSGAAYSAVVLPELDPLIRACGYSRTDDFSVGTENISYAPADTGHDSCTIYGWGSANLYKFVGCRGMFEIPLEAGAFSTVVFTMSGIMVADPAAAALPAFTYDSPIAPNAVNMALTIGTWVPGGYSGAFRSGGSVQRLDSVNAAEGIDEFAITGHNPLVEVSARTIALATYDPYADARARTQRTIDWTAGATQYNKINLDVNEAYANETPHGENAEMAAWEGLTYICQDAAVLFN